MKKLLIISVLLVCGVVAVNAQIIYTPFKPNRSQPTTKQQEQAIRATAYYADSYSGNIYKVPIKIQEHSNGYGNATYYVTEYYVNSGIGGRWQRLTYPAQISKCNSALASNSLEKQFIYKALVNTQYYYFDF